MSSQNRSSRDDRAIPEPPNESEAEALQSRAGQQRGIRLSIIWAGVALVAIIVSGFVITIVAGRTPADRPRDVPPSTVTSSILGPPGDNRNNNG